MAKIPKDIERVINDFLRDLGSEIPIEKVILFGSYANGDYNSDSDIDLAIFSDYFKNVNSIEGTKYLLKRARDYRGFDIQPIPFVKEDYDKQLGFAKEIILTGIELK